MISLDHIVKLFDEGDYEPEVANYAKDCLYYLMNEMGYSVNTLRSYAGDLRFYFDWAKDAKVNPLSPNHKQLRRFCVYLEQCGYKKTTVNRRLSSVRTFLGYLDIIGVNEGNPAKLLSSPKLEKRLPRKLSYSDTKRLLSVCDVNDVIGLRDQAFLELLYASGARISEIAALKVLDIDFAQQTVRLFGKGSKERIVPLHHLALATLSDYLKSSRPELLSEKQTDAVFVSSRGNAMSADSLRKVFKQRALEAGLDSALHPHDMRHAFASDLLEDGADLKSVQELLGHSSLSTTQVYTHLSVQHLKDTLVQSHPRG